MDESTSRLLGVAQRTWVMLVAADVAALSGRSLNAVEETLCLLTLQRYRRALNATQMATFLHHNQTLTAGPCFVENFAALLGEWDGDLDGLAALCARL